MHAEKQHAREPGDLQHALESMRRPVREGHKPNGGRARAGEVGLRRNTCEPTEQGKATSCGGRGGKGAAGGEPRSTAHAPDSEQESACPRDGTVRVKQASVTGSLSRYSSFRRTVCVDAHVRICAGGRSAMGVPTATLSGGRVEVGSEVAHRAAPMLATV